MFCHKCGNKVAEGGGFCHKCGTQVTQAPASTVQQAPVAPVPVDASIASAPAAVPSVSDMAQPNADFIQYVDNYVRTNTKHQTAADLWLNGKPNNLIVLVAVPGFILSIVTFFSLLALFLGNALPFVLAGIISIILSFVVFYILCTLPLRFMAFLIKLGIERKFSMTPDKRIDDDRFLLFLNNNLSFLIPNLSKWHSNGNVISCLETNIEIVFPDKESEITQFYFRTPNSVIDNNKTGCLGFIFRHVAIFQLISFIKDCFTIGKGGLSVFYRSVPILSGVIDYYLKVQRS